MTEWLKHHLLDVLGDKDAHVEVRDNGIRVSAGPFHYVICWATIGALLRRHVHPAQWLAVGKVLTAAGRYVTDVARGAETGEDAKAAGSAMGNR